MFAVIDLTQIGLWILYIALPILVLYFLYLLLTKAFNYMGFSSIEAIIIVFVSLIFYFDIFILGVNISNIYLFSYNNWALGINAGGALIPIFLSIYLTIKKKIPLKMICTGIILVSIITYLVTRVDVSNGIVASAPYFLFPAVAASFISIILLWKNFRKAAPLAYISGSIGVLIGADVFHLWELLGHPIDTPINAIIGGANVFDMIYITGILAVILDGILMFRQRSKEGMS